MDERYQDAEVRSAFSPPTTFLMWFDILDAVSRAQYQHRPKPIGTTRDIEYERIRYSHPNGLAPSVRDVIQTEGMPQVIADHQRRAGHEVVGFLDWLMPQLAAEQARWVYYGMTSSDLMDTAMGLRFARLIPVVAGETGKLVTALERAARAYADTPLLGRTHGQVAEPTTLGWRIQGWYHGIRATRARLTQAMYAMAECKVSGPVGTFVHNPPQIEREVARRLGLSPAGTKCGQVIPRHALAYWATSAAQYVAALGRAATDIRLMASRGLVQEAAATARVGSSAMPAKRNPMTSERVCSLGRVAAGYAQMLQAVDLWEDRDLTNSAVERIAIPDLLHTVLQATRDLLSVVDSPGLVIHSDRMLDEIRQAGHAPYAALHFNGLIRMGYDRAEARRQTSVWVESDPELQAYDLGTPALDGFTEVIASSLTGGQGLRYGGDHGEAA